MDEPLQKSLERYDVLDRIAVGGMAEVFLAKAYGAHGFEKTLAIKRILPELARDPEFEARFIAEAKVAVRLSHANVVQVFDFGRIGESLFIAMEFVDGLDLAALLRKFKDEGRLVPLPAAFHIAIEIMRAIDFAHSHGVVHRDVSPSNILLSRAGEVKIADFGIAVAAQPHKGATPGVRKVMGKWRYMSPEQARGDTLDTRSDLFSAASVMFELFTGTKLFPGDEAPDIVKNIENMVIPRAASMRSGLPSRLDEILAGPLARKPIDRPNRPAVVLRSLIELSYESSIMATSLDVAEAVALVVPAKRSSGGAQLDDVIRKQLGEKQEKSSVARRTAVTDGKPPSTETVERGERGEVSTGLFRKIDLDGLSRLEELEVDPTAVAAPRARRASEGPMPAASSPDSGVHKLLDAHFDKDRHTEVGGPPTGQVPKSEPDAIAEPSITKSVTATLTGAPRRTAAIALVALALVGGGVAIFALTRGGGSTVVAAKSDGGVVVAPQQALDLDSDPSGATIVIDGKTVGKTPQKVAVAADTSPHVRLELAGYSAVEIDFHTKAGQTEHWRPKLGIAPAMLHVDTDPEGAQVTIDGVKLGDTPLDKPANAKKGAEIVISKQGYDSIKQTVDLVAGDTLPIKQTLKAMQKFGIVKIVIKGTHGHVFFKGRDLGENMFNVAPVEFKLPVGRQQLKIEPKNGSPRTISVDVTESPQTVKLD